MKRLLVFTFLFVFAFQAIGLAAVGGSKKSFSPAPKPPTTQKAAPSTPAPDTSSGYKPSAPASSYSDKAPAAATKPGQATAPVQQPSSGGFLRNMALLGGGMMLGSMLGSMFGFGAGSFFAEMIGMLFNVILLVGAFMGIRYLWNRFKKSKEEKNPYKQNY